MLCDEVTYTRARMPADKQARVYGQQVSLDVKRKYVTWSGTAYIVNPLFYNPFFIASQEKRDCEKIWLLFKCAIISDDICEIKQQNQFFF